MIKVTEKYSIDSDGKQYTVLEHKEGINKKGEPTKYDTVVGYHTSLTSALKSLIDHEHKQIIAGNDLTLSEAVKVLNAKTEEFINLVK